MLNSESKDFVRLNHLPLNTVLTDHISATFPLSLGYRLVRLPFMLSAPHTIRNRYKDFHVYITRDRHSDSPYFIRHNSEGSKKQTGESMIIGWQKRKKETAEPNEVVSESNQTGFASLVDDGI